MHAKKRALWASSQKRGDFMAEFSIVTPQHEAKWNLRVIHGEINQLKREQSHLLSKSSERPLSVWEASRLDEIFDELTALLAEIRSSGAHRVKKDIAA
jgi:hypothetical protein